MQPTPRQTSVGNDQLSPADAHRVLGPSWYRDRDFLWSVVSGSDGLSVVRANISDAASWRNVVTLTKPGVESRQWIGQGCLIRHTHVIAVAYGPVEYIDVSSMMEHGAFTALVNLDSGHVIDLPYGATFGYFSPSCGADSTATFTSFLAGEGQTVAVSVASDGAFRTSSGAVPGELIDAVDDSAGHLLAVRANEVVQLSNGHGSRVTTNLPGSAYDLHTTPAGDFVYAVDEGARTDVYRQANSSATLIAHGKRGDVAIDAAESDLVIHGASVRADTRVSGVKIARAAFSAAPSVTGRVFAAVSGYPGIGAGVSAEVANLHGDAARVALASSAFANNSSSRSSAAMTPQATAAAATTTSVTTDANLPCAVQRNDVKLEAYQPTVAQVEWAVDEGIDNQLMTARGSTYRHFGLSSYTAQKLFPLPALTGGGSIPPQVMLGILANESNLWQASSHVSPGGYGNPLTGNIYGRDFTQANTLTINFSNADCGYGIAQITDNMRKSQMALNTQKAVALDYQVNIAAGLRTLALKWNQLKSYSPPINMNDGNPVFIENWYAAAWAYNTGLQPNAANGNTTNCTPGPTCTDSAGNWGLGWANNPSNPIYPANRHLFNSDGSDPSHPADWPYQERVIGWAAFPIYEPDGSYTQAWWTSDSARAAAIPSPSLFCNSTNHCTMGSSTGSCNYGDDPNVNPLADHCWLHHGITWRTDCSQGYCGHGQAAYASGAAEPADGTTADPADCATASLPTGSIVVDDIPSASPSPYAPCHNVTTKGSFAFTFTSDANGNYPAHIDLHQINGGLNGHYWFTHTSQTNDITTFKGTWSFPTTAKGWGRLLVHVPALGAQTGQAVYTITDAKTGATQIRVLDQGWGSNQWLSLGAFNFTATFSAGMKVSLSSYSPTDDTGRDIAFDAVAFAPGIQPRYKVVALGDSYSSGEGVSPFLANSDNGVDECHRSPQAYPELITLPGASTPLGQDNGSELDFIACSGIRSTAVTTDAVNSSPSQEFPYDTHWDSPMYGYHEAIQTSTGYLDAMTDAVTISVGGDDARFADVIKTCAISGAAGNDCSANGYVMSGDQASLNTYEAHIIRDLLPAKLAAVYQAIHQQAPNAVIFVVGYPRLFPTDYSTQVGCPGAFDVTVPYTAQNWLNSMADLLAQSEQSVVSTLAGQGMKIHFINSIPAFTGHDVCESGSTGWINGIVGVPWSPGTGSFHPKASGQAAYAALVTSAMQQYLPLK